MPVLAKSEPDYFGFIFLYKALLDNIWSRDVGHISNYNFLKYFIS